MISSFSKYEDYHVLQGAKDHGTDDGTGKPIGNVLLGDVKQG